MGLSVFDHLCYAALHCEHFGMKETNDLNWRMLIDNELCYKINLFEDELSEHLKTYIDVKPDTEYVVYVYLDYMMESEDADAHYAIIRVFEGETGPLVYEDWGLWDIIYSLEANSLGH